MLKNKNKSYLCNRAAKCPETARQPNGSSAKATNQLPTMQPVKTSKSIGKKNF